MIKKEKWNRIKSKGKKGYVLKSIFIYEVFILLIVTFDMFVFNRTTLSNIPQVIFIYLFALIVYIPLGVWVGNNSWNANIRRFEK